MPRTRAYLAALVFLAVCSSRPAWAGPERLQFPVRTKSLTLSVYKPSGVAHGTVIVGSGDAGWVGLAVNISEFLVQQGYVVVGFNVREYLSVFTVGTQHLSIVEARSDYGALSQWLAGRGLLHHPVLLSGVSEGAALAVVAAGDPRNRTWVDGVVSVGLPATAELAWRWMDWAALIMKRDAYEPSFSPIDYVAAVTPIPLAMIQSSTDEYISDSDRTRLLNTAKAPKKMIMIAAANHRFTDKLPELHAELLAAIAWVNTAVSPPRRTPGD